MMLSAVVQEISFAKLLTTTQTDRKSIHTTDGLLLDVVESVGGGVNDLALDLVRPTTVVPQAADAHADVDLGHGDGLAVVERLNRGEQVQVLLEQVGELHEKSATVLWGLFPPWALEGLACGGDGNVDILLRGLLDRGDDTLVCGVDHIEGPALCGFDELVVDEPGEGS
jgi:hypothetical protein